MFQSFSCRLVCSTLMCLEDLQPGWDFSSLQERHVCPGGAGWRGAAVLEAGSGYRADGALPSCLSVPLPTGFGPAWGRHHLLLGLWSPVPAVLLPGALQVCVLLQLIREEMKCWAVVTVLCRLTPRNCRLLSEKSLSESQPWCEMLVKIQEITRDLSGTTNVFHLLGYQLLKLLFYFSWIWLDLLLPKCLIKAASSACFFFFFKDVIGAELIILKNHQALHWWGRRDTVREKSKIKEKRCILKKTVTGVQLLLHCLQILCQVDLPDTFEPFWSHNSDHQMWLWNNELYHQAQDIRQIYMKHFVDKTITRRAITFRNSFCFDHFRFVVFSVHKCGVNILFFSPEGWISYNSEH